MVHTVPNCGFARCYVVSGKDGLMVVDVGSAGTADDVRDYIKSEPGISLDMVKCITATHFHIDHIGGIGHFLVHCPATVRVLFHNLVKSYLEGERRISLISEWRSGLLPATLVSLRYVRKISHLHFESAAGIPIPGLGNMVNLPFDQQRISYFGARDDSSYLSASPNEKIAPITRPDSGATPPDLKRYPLGFDQWEVIETPGHTEDSLCFYNALTEELICGDLIINMEKSGPGKLNRFCWEKAAMVNSYESLRASISVKTIYPGHGEIIRDKDNTLLKVRAFQA